jgi:hypothetical protein
MIISFDGNVFTGKTFIIKKLNEVRGYNYIPEHSDFLPKIVPKKIFTEKAKNEQLRYLKTDLLRQVFITKNQNLLDRSFLSMSAHVYALFKTGRSDIRVWYIDKLKEYFKKGKIIIPDKYIYVTCSYEIAKKRFRMDTVKGTDDMYMKKEYFNIIEKFDRAVLRNFSNLVVDTGKSVDYDRIIYFVSQKSDRPRKSDIIKVLTKEMFN